MKKYLKNMAKKSMSLFLAVIMVLSCWVWMAPEEAKKAEAAAAGYTTYKFTVTYVISTRPYGSGHIQYKTSSTNLGWGADDSAGNYQTHIGSLASGVDDDNNNTAAVGQHKVTIDTGTAFPTAIAIRGATQGDGCGDSDLRITNISINGKEVWTGSHGFSGAGANAEHTAEIWTSKTAEGSGSNNGTFTGTYKWAPPLIAGFEDIDDNKASAEGISTTLSKVGGADAKTGVANFDLTKYTYYNQYGIKFSEADGLAYLNAQKFAGEVTTTTHIAGGTENSADVTEYADYIWVNPENENQAVVSPELQVEYPQPSSGTAKFHLVRTYTIKNEKLDTEATSRVSAPITVTYPKYPVNFDAGLSGVKFIYNGGSEVNKVFSRSGYNGGTIEVPTDAEKAGYTFYGFWSEPQPESGNANYNALETDFAKPCSTEDYNSYKASGTVNGDIVTDSDGNKWYDAGKPMDPTTVKTIDVSDNYANYTENWYGWWLAKDLTLKFYDVDGKFLGEKAVKSGQTQDDITWPKSSYIDSGYTTGAFKFKVDKDIWVNTDGEEIDKNSYTFTKNLVLTPKLTRESFTDKYAVKFTDPNTGSSVAVGTDGNYAYRADIKSYADTAIGMIADTPNDVNGALDYSYELLGWSSVEPTTGKNYHVLLEDADFDVNGTAIGLNEDWIVRSAATYYPVYRRHVKTYVVDFKYKDATGADATRQIKVKYGTTLVPPTEYVPYTYVTKGFGFTFDKWSYKTSAGPAQLDYNGTIPFTSENISIAGTALDGSADFKPIVIDATYGEPVATPYAVTFNYVDDKGEDKTYNAEVKNEQFITEGIVNSLKPAVKWDDGEAEYTYADQWEITEGAATVGINGTEVTVGDKIDTDDLTELTPTSNLTFKAVYANPVPFYTVTYVDGTKTVTYRLLQGTNVPAWTEKVTNDNGTPDDTSDDREEDKIYVPADYEGEGGTFKFQGWYDEKQTDADLKATNGNKVTTADKVTRNLTLYSQFKFIPDTFDIKFMSYDGKVQLSAGKFEKGQSIESIVAVANVAAQGRASDDVYDYLFLGWDKPVPTHCEGQDVTFIAQYKPVYKYYNVKWYNSRLVDGNWVADKSKSTVDGEDVETYLLATTHHTYNSKLYTPAVDNLTCLETAPAGQNYVFAGWYYNDAEGNAVKYERGMLVTAEMEFYATYTLTNKVYTVTTVVKGEETKYDVASGETATIPEPQAGYIDKTKHDAFAGWYTDAACTDGKEFDLDTVINTDTKIYAKFVESAHAFTNKALKTAPTYYKEGGNEVWCSCSADNTKKDESIAKLTDTKVPTGTIYLGDKSWSSNGTPAYETDNDPISIFVNANTDVIITSNDTGDVNALYNPSGIGKGVQVIRAFAFPAETVLTANNYGAAQDLAIDVYVDDTEALTNNANFAVKLGDVIVADLDENGNPQYDDEGNIKSKALQSGESYIIYYYVTDKAGNQLNRLVRTAKFIYDNTKPVFTVEGNSNNAALPTYCGTATVTGIEKDVVLTVNGTAVEVKYADGAETGTYEIKHTEGVDNVIIVATDKAGNTYSKKIKVNDHSYVVSEKASSCGVAGYKKEVCIVCGDVKTNETYPALDHTYEMTVIEADCVNIGVVINTCSICGDVVETRYEADGETPVIPALGHAFEKDENGNIVYTTVTASTCKTKGLAEAYCTECKGELKDGYITKELDLDPANHEDVSITEVAADCVNNGYYTKACSCGVTIEHKDHTTDPDIYAAKGHGETVWEVIKEANCYQAGTMVGKCAVCTTIVVEETAYGYTESADGDYAYVTEIQNEGTEEEAEVKVTEEIDGKTYYKYYLLPATGEHVKYVTEKVESVPGQQGHVKYACKVDGCPWTGYKELDKVEAYTVTFLKEDGTELTKITKDEGEYIANTDVTAPEKAATKENTYSFAGWVEVIKGEDGKETAGATYKLPLEVTKNMTLKASYKATKILYTHTFVVPDEWVSATADEVSTVQFAKLVGGYGDERVPAAIPTFKHKDADEDARLKALYTFEFKGWKSAKGELVTDFTITDDAEFTAYFIAVPIEYDVIFYNGSEVIWTTKVDGGAVVEYANIDNKGTEDEADDVLILPEKAYDDDNHYAFNNKWYTDAACENEYVIEYNADGSIKSGAITEKTRLYAGFTATAHTHTVNTKVGTVVDEANPEIKDGIIQKADCVLPEITAKICSCGHEIEEETAAALGHDQYKRDAEGNHILVDGEKVINGANEEVGADKVIHYVVRCSVCNEVLSSDKISVTVKFVNYNNNVLGRKNYTLNDKIKYEGETPVKADDKENTYTFAGWSIDGDESGKIYTNDQLGNATVDVTFVAQFTASKKYYKVSYVDYNNNLLYNYTVTVDGKVIEGVVYGAALPEYKGTTNPATLTGPDYTEEGHYVFDKWEYDATYLVKGDVVVHPTFKLVAHNKQITKTPATCTKAGGDTITCTGCAYHATVNATEPALGHAWGEGVVTTPPVFETQTPGVMTYTCTRCGVTKTEEIPGDSYTIKATVKDSNGNPSSGVRVELLRKQDDGSYTYLTHKETDNNGVVIFAGLEKGDYRVYVTSTKTYNDATVNEDGSVTGGDITAQPENKPVDNSCKCSCHKNNFWGTIYRLIQKIIKFFTGKPSCCADPDGRI